MLFSAKSHMYKVLHIIFVTVKIDGERNDMKEVFQEYGSVIITIIAIIALIAVVTAIIGTGEDGIIGSAFVELIEQFLDQAGLPLDNQ